ncbi:hypothetical protein [Burkholderia multivorans]|uniref:hypothetical protein n=1 Tax=Burkholderia multivorans TaxID=87883 RepID=UPI0021BF8B97|nr:hypothetical protein [Burkholderia multivorans]
MNRCERPTQNHPLLPHRDHLRYNSLTAQHHLPDRSRSPKRLITIAEIRSFTHLLRLSFADVDFLSPSLSKKSRGKLVHAFTAEQARAIRSFVQALPTEIVSVVVHCEGGYSRSCAIALALHQLYGYRAEIEQLSQANPSIVRVMMGDVCTRHREPQPTRR